MLLVLIDSYSYIPIHAYNISYAVPLVDELLPHACTDRDSLFLIDVLTILTVCIEVYSL